MLLKAARSHLLIVDTQERLAPAVHESDAAISNIERLVAGALLLGPPIVITEHYSIGLGPTIARVRDAAGADAPVFEKITFSAAADERFARHIAWIAHAQERRQLVVCGFETHVCVMQSAIDFAARGYEVFLVADATSSRAPSSVDFALRRMERAGVTLVTTEMVLFEWLGRGGTDDFRNIVKLIK